MGSLGFAFETPEEANERVSQYFDLIREECMPIGAANRVSSTKCKATA